MQFWTAQILCRLDFAWNEASRLIEIFARRAGTKLIAISVVCTAAARPRVLTGTGSDLKYVLWLPLALGSGRHVALSLTSQPWYPKNHGATSPD